MHIHCDNQTSVLIQVTKDYCATIQQKRELQKEKKKLNKHTIIFICQSLSKITPTQIIINNI